MRLPSLRRRDDAAGRPPAPFVVGANRSGTTLLRMMLDAHQELTIPPETHFVPDVIQACEDGGTPEEVVEVMTSHREWGDFDLDADEVLERLRALDPLTAGDALRTFYGLYAQRAGKPRWGEKTPGYATNMIEIQKALPEARFVHLIRDGRDVALSAMDRAKKPLTAGQVAKRWQRRITKARKQSRKVNHYLEARYEDLVLDTEPTLRRITDFLELPWDPGMLEYHERAAERLNEMARELPATDKRPQLEQDHRLKIHALTKEPPKKDRVERWREQMSEQDRVAFEQIAGELLKELGYAVGEPVAPAGARS
jgi:sulfotransferase family protein